MNSLRFIREEHNMPVAQLAALLGVSRSTVYDWESGGRDIPFSKAIAIADIFEISLQELAATPTDAALMRLTVALMRDLTTESKQKVFDLAQNLAIEEDRLSRHIKIEQE